MSRNYRNEMAQDKTQIPTSLGKAALICLALAGCTMISVLGTHNVVTVDQAIKKEGSTKAAPQIDTDIDVKKRAAGKSEQ